MKMMEIEAAARAAWPALVEEDLCFGVLRYSGGVDRRANSLSLYPGAEVQIESLVTAAEEFFAVKGRVPIVRVVRPSGKVSSPRDEVDRTLRSRGYAKRSPTETMLLDLRGEPRRVENPKNEFTVAVDAESWLHAWYTLTGRNLADLETHRALLESSELRYHYLLRRDAEGLPLISGMAALQGNGIGLFGIATASSYRRRGYASAIVESLLQWGKVQGARYVYLQVEESNRAAANLYRKMGFRKSYSYWYWVGNLPARESED